MDIGVLTVVATLLVAMGIAAWYRVYARFPYTDGRRFRAWVAGLLSAVAFAAGYFEVAHHQRQQLATEALGVLSDVKGAKANCERLTEEMFSLSPYQGYVYYDGSNVAHLRRGLCHDLWDYAHGGQSNPTDAQVRAVHIVAHETMHINDVRSESTAECMAVQLNHLVAEELGATPEEARELERRYYVDWYPLQRSDYVSGECREGGLLDMYPDRTEFP